MQEERKDETEGKDEVEGHRAFASPARLVEDEDEVEAHKFAEKFAEGPGKFAEGPDKIVE